MELPIGRFFGEIPWDFVLNPDFSCEQNLTTLTDIVNYGRNSQVPLKVVKVRMNDRPWMNPNLKRLFQERQKAFVKVESVMKFCIGNCEVQSIKILDETKAKELKQTKPKDWWRGVNRLCNVHSRRFFLENLKHDTIDHRDFETF